MEHDLTQAALESLRQVDVRTVDTEALVDIRDIKIDKELPREQRIAEFISQIRNPYCFKVGDVAVSVSFSDDGVTFNQRMENYLQTL